jgi:hypothetical protein
VKLQNVSLKRKLVRALGWMASIGLLTLSSLAHAQAPSPFAVETNLPGVYAFTQPPAGFDPLTASPADLDRYGYPQRPAADESPKAFATWAMVTNPALKRVVPQLERTNIYHRPAAGLVTKGAKKWESSNWSGYAVTQKSPLLTSVTGAWTVPPVQQAFGTCDGGWDYSSEWVGIDGFNNSELFQAGSEADAFCSGGETATNYDPWVEWLPESEIILTGAVPVVPGDYLIVTVTATNWSHGESSNGTLLFTDVTQQWQVSAAYTAASLGGTFVVGKSAEWIVERPEVGGSFATLANYIADPWFAASAKDLGNKTHLPGSPKLAVSNVITMLDNGSSPISYVDLSGTETLWFFDEGSAF